MDKTLCCGECHEHFLYEDYYGYGICGQDRQMHKCDEPCAYGHDKHD